MRNCCTRGCTSRRRTSDKVELLRQIYLRYRPETLKFFVKVITGNLRIGLQAKMVEEAIAEATHRPLEDVQMANNRLGDLSTGRSRGPQGTLHDIEARLFHPMDFMLAKPLDVLDDSTILAHGGSRINMMASGPRFMPKMAA